MTGLDRVRQIWPPVFGPRNSVMRYLRGEEVPEDAYLRDTSEWISVSHICPADYPELWVDKIHDYVGEESPDI